MLRCNALGWAFTQLGMPLLVFKALICDICGARIPHPFGNGAWGAPAGTWKLPHLWCFLLPVSTWPRLWSGHIGLDGRSWSTTIVEELELMTHDYGTFGQGTTWHLCSWACKWKRLEVQKCAKCINMLKKPWKFDALAREFCCCKYIIPKTFKIQRTANRRLKHKKDR